MFYIKWKAFRHDVAWYKLEERLTSELTMQNNKSVHDFLTYGDLKNFNDKVASIVSVDYTSNKNAQDNQNKDTVESVPFDSSRFTSALVAPDAIDQDVLYQLADIIDKKTAFNKIDSIDTEYKGPTTVDKLLNSVAVAFVSEDGMPVGVASLIDPSVENYKNIIPQNYYELKTGFPLSGRLEQEFFITKPEYKQLGVSGELRGLLQTASPNMFVVVPSSDNETIEGLKNNKYRYIAQFDTDWESEPVQLWIN